MSHILEWKMQPSISSARASLGAQMVKIYLQCNQVQYLAWEDLLEKGMATHSSILAWKILWTEEPDRLQSVESQGAGHDWMTKCLHAHTPPRYAPTRVVDTLPLGWASTSLLVDPWNSGRVYSENLTFPSPPIAWDISSGKLAEFVLLKKVFWCPLHIFNDSITKDQSHL